MKLHTGNRRRRAAHRHQMIQEARAFDERQGRKPSAMRKRHLTGFVRRQKARAKSLRLFLRGV